MRKPFIGGNWKMHGSLAKLSTLASTVSLQLADINNVEVALFPSFVYLSAIHHCIANTTIALGAQNHCQYSQGAYTGEVSAAMLKELGCRYVIIGHSERRRIYGESEEALIAKFRLAKRYHLCPVFCLGETLTQRVAGNAAKTIITQLQVLIDAVGIENIHQTILAYEPVWAINSGKTATPAQAQEMHNVLRQQLSCYDIDIANHIRIIYGGGVNANNAALLFAKPDIDGGLIGSASLEADSFVAICQAAVRFGSAMANNSNQ